MINIVLTFTIFFLSFFFGIKIFREMSDNERWSLTKYAGYSILCSTLTVLALSLIVWLF